MIGKLTREKQIEIAFIVVFSVLIFAIFYTLTSMNGLILGNDPSVHLTKAQIFLQTGHISLSGLSWMPPLFDILLAMLISTTGATTVGQYIFLVKALAVIADWLLFLTVYLIGSKFFNKRVAVVSAVLLSMCFPLYELNAWGGYTTVLGIAFIFLVLLYLPLAADKFGYLLVTFFVGFGLVLSHQLAAFLAVIILPPIMLFMLIKSKGKYLKVLIALFLGGGIAFALYYLPVMIGYLGILIDVVFFAQTSYAYQIPYASFSSFLGNFGFIFFFALAGIFTATYLLLKVKKKPLFYMILLLSFIVPLFFAESYLFGFYMPFQWFIYYLTPPTAIFAAVFLVFIAEKSSAYYTKNRQNVRKNLLKIGAVSLVVLMCLLLVFRSDTVYNKILGASVFYSTTDVKAYDAGVWLQQNYPGDATVVDTQVPGYWFSIFCGKDVISQTNAAEGTNDIADSVLSLSYQIQTSQTSLRAYEAKGVVTDETYVPINQVWYNVASSSTSGDFLSFTQSGVNYKFAFTQFSREIYFDDASYPKQIAFIYTNDYAAVTETMTVQNNSYPIAVSWAVTPLQSNISNVTLYLTTSFNLQFDFDKAQMPQLMDWVNPWDAPSKTTGGPNGDAWAVVSFTNSNSTDNYLGLFDDKNQLAYAFNFTDLPDWGNVGALPSRQIDAVRFQYQFNQINVNQTVTRQYQILTLSKNSFPTLQPSNLQSLFNYQPIQFSVSSSDFKDYIAQNNIAFIVYDRNQLDPNMVRCKFLQQIYSNDRYVIFKILSNYNQTQT